MKLILTDFISSLKFHLKTIDTGGIYIKLDSSGWHLASLPDIYSQTWCLENIPTSEEIKTNSPLCFYFDKQTAQSFLASVGRYAKSSYDITLEDNLLTISNSNITFRTQLNCNDSSIFDNKSIFDTDNSSSFSTFIEIDEYTWKMVKRLSGWIKASSYFKAICGVFIDTNGYIYAADTNTVYIAKTNKIYDKPFFMPQNIISYNISPGSVKIETNEDSVLINMGTIKFLINSPAEGNFITKNTVFPADEPRNMIKEYPGNHDILWELDNNALEIINDAFLQYKIAGISDDPKFNISLYDHGNDCKLSVVSKNNKIDANLGTAMKTSKVINLPQNSQSIFASLNDIIDKKDLNAKFTISTVTNDTILALWSNTLHTESTSNLSEEILILTSNINISHGK